MTAHTSLAVILLAALAPFAAAETAIEMTRCLPNPPPADERVAHVRSLHEGSGFQPYADRAKWTERATDLRERVLVAAGLWPPPARTPLNAVIHGRIDRDDYTVEKVYFESYPGFFVSGNLYRPKGKPGPFPGILCPHGHWADGRFNEVAPKEVEKQIKGGWETDPDAARYILQARCANLAKLGCVVFHYDMVGYADSDPQRFPHRKTYLDLDSDLRLISVFGLQTWDGIRALDFLESLPDVDRARLACTGASGGATQTFALMCADARLAAAAPVCMISAGEHQGGCVCENNSLLRVGTDNVELAASFAPRPFVHPTATGDWTHAFLEHGFPEIQATYRLFGAEAEVESMRQTANHNYNRVSREVVYNFFNRKLRLGHEGTITEQKFTPIPPKELSVWDDARPRPANAVDAADLKRYLIEAAAAQLAALKPTDQASAASGRDVLRVALRHMVSSRLPDAGEVHAEPVGRADEKGFTVERLLVGRTGEAFTLPLAVFVPARPSGTVTVVVSPAGKATLLKEDGTPEELLAALLAVNQTVVAPDVFRTGERAAPPRPSTQPAVEFFAGYNRTTLANRVHDTLTALAFARARARSNPVCLVGVGRAGPWCLLAHALAGDAVARVAADVTTVPDFAVATRDDDDYLPGSLRYGGLWPLAGDGIAGRALLIGVEAAPAWVDRANGNPPRVARTFDAREIARWFAELLKDGAEPSH